MRQKKLHVIGGDSGYANWILPLGFNLTDKLENSDLCMLTGGEDWSHSWYKCDEPHSSMFCSIERDYYEMDIIREALKRNIPIIGICRGSQILPVLVDKNRGRIVQHQDNPSFIHEMVTYDGLTIPISSTHHECAWPYDLIEGKEYKLLGWSENLLRFRYMDAHTQDRLNPETEVVVYPNTGGGMIGYQMHPEMIYDEGYDLTIKWCQNTLLKFLDGGFKEQYSGWWM